MADAARLPAGPDVELSGTGAFGKIGRRGEAALGKSPDRRIGGNIGKTTQSEAP